MNQELINKIVENHFENELGTLKYRYTKKQLRQAIEKALQNNYPDEEADMCLSALESMDDIGIDIWEATLIVLITTPWPYDPEQE